MRTATWAVSFAVLQYRGGVMYLYLAAWEQSTCGTSKSKTPTNFYQKVTVLQIRYGEASSSNT